MPKPAAARTVSVPKISKTNYVPVLIAVLVIAAVAIALFAGGGQKKQPVKAPQHVSACGPYRDDLNIKVGDQVLRTEIASSSEQLKRGLGGRPCILPDQALLLKFSKPSAIRIWMKDMKFPIDAIWIDSSHKVVAEEIDLSPNTYPDSFVNKDHSAQYVLEVKANRSKELNINLGTTINF